MFRAGSLLTVITLAGAMGLALVSPARAQYGGGFTGPRGVNNLETLEQAGPNSLHHQKSDTDLMKEAKRKIIDADPRVRVEALEGLRYIADKNQVNELLFRGANDTDVRVRIKAFDILGARGVNEAVALMSQALFLRETPAVEKLHLVAALGRIGDARGTLPILEYLAQTDDASSRGTAVFALGEIGDPAANDKLIDVVSNDKSALVRKLAQEAIEKIDGELPNHQQEQAAEEKQKGLQPTDEKLSKLREMDEAIAKQRGY